MDNHYANNFTGSFQGMIPNYNPQDSQAETKDFHPQQTHQDSNFTVMMSNVLNAGPFDGNNLYSDLDAIEPPALNNMLYEPLVNNFMGNQGMFPPSTISQGVFNSKVYDSPDLQQLSLHQQVPTSNPMQETSIMQVPGSSPMPVHSNSIQVPVPTSNPILSHQNMQSNLLSEGLLNVPQSHQNVIHSNCSTVDTSLLNPIPPQSFYSPSPMQTLPVQAPGIQNPTIQNPTPVEPIPNVHQAMETNGTSSNTTGNVTYDANIGHGSPNVEHDSANVRQSGPGIELDNGNVGQVNANLNIPQEATNEPANDPVASDNVDNDGDESSEAVDNGGENGEGAAPSENDSGKDQLGQCVRDGCENTAVVNPEWEDEYCSNECCVRHCKSVFNEWVENNRMRGLTTTVDVGGN